MRYEMSETEYGYQFYDNVDGVSIETDEDLIEALNSQAQQIEELKKIIESKRAGACAVMINKQARKIEELNQQIIELKDKS